MRLAAIDIAAIELAEEKGATCLVATHRGGIL
jgi:hypothetical protein